MLPSTTDDSLLSNLSPGDLYRYRRTCKDCKEAVDSYIRRHFRFHDILERYFKPDEILPFRRLQWRTGMFISGSTALQFLDRIIYPDSDLDLYVEHRFRRVIVTWLIGIGYTYIPSVLNPNETLEESLEATPDHIRYYGRFYSATWKGYLGAASLLNFEKQEPHRKIQLITKHQAPLQMVLNFHSTCVMNIITHEKAYSIFPRGTFDERRSLLYLPMTEERQQMATSKYSARGFEIVVRNSREEASNPKSAFSEGPRHLGDGKCWTLPLFPKLDFSEGSIETNSWRLRYHNYAEEMTPTMRSMAFVSPKLRYGYLIADGSMREYVFWLSRVLLDEEFKDEKEVDYVFTAMIKKYRISQKGEKKIGPGANNQEKLDKFQWMFWFGRFLTEREL